MSFDKMRGKLINSLSSDNFFLNHNCLPALVESAAVSKNQILILESKFLLSFLWGVFCVLNLHHSKD